MQHGERLALNALHRHETHRGPARRLADRLGVDGVIFSALHAGLGVSRGHKPRLMAELCDLPRPIMRRAAGFHRHHARIELGEKGQNLMPFELLAQNAPALEISRVNLKNLLGEVQTDYGKYPPAKPGALRHEPLKAAAGDANAAPIG